MEVIKITKKTYKVLEAVDKPFLNFGQFRKSRESIGLLSKDSVLTATTSSKKKKMSILLCSKELLISYFARNVMIRL